MRLVLTNAGLTPKLIFVTRVAGVVGITRTNETKTERIEAILCLHDQTVTKCFACETALRLTF